MPGKRKGSKKGKPKKAAIVVPPFYDYSTWTPPTWRPAFPNDPAAFGQIANQTRVALKDRSEHRSVILRLRQADWEHQDAFVLVQKSWTIHRIMRDMIAGQMCGGAVDASDVVVLVENKDMAGTGGVEKSADALLADEELKTGTGTAENAGGEASTTEREGRGPVIRPAAASTTTAPVPKRNNNEEPPSLERRGRANPMAAIESCFEEVVGYKLPGKISTRPPFSNITNDTTQPGPTSENAAPSDSKTSFTLPYTTLLRPGMVIPAHVLHANLIQIAQAQADAARQQQLAQAAAAVASSRGMVPGAGRRAVGTAGPAARRQSFMMQPMGVQRSNSVAEMPPVVVTPGQVQLPPAVTLWFDIASYTGMNSNIRTASLQKSESSSNLQRPLPAPSSTTRTPRPLTAKPSMTMKVQYQNPKSHPPSIILAASLPPEKPVVFTTFNDATNPPKSVHRFDLSDPVIMFETWQSLLKTRR
ncbi:hypothetical protein DFS34DRAFT_102645 [Phlyctochytrium arcticum]|nr:hypothetical protein DFS34DRAFT_102645 [Phlyctochytrium arcticum]